MKQKMNNGITLIILVITIIVLLIIAGVSIATLTGENGILTKSDMAKAQTQKASAKEQAQIDILAWQTEKMENNESAELSDSIIKEILTGKNYVASLGDTSFTTKEGGYEISYFELYKVSTKILNETKTTIELYDGINDESDENYNENAMHIGDYVNYTAGKWTESKAAPTEETPFTFGGYTAGQSRNTNASGSYTFTDDEGVIYGEGKYEGWRIWDISEDKQTITLISAGCPEVYYHPYGENYIYNTEQILTGITTGTIDSTQPSTPRVWDNYVNTAQYTSNGSIRVMKKSDLDTWYEKYIDSGMGYYTGDMPLNTENKLISIVKNGFFYWIFNFQSSNAYYISPRSNSISSSGYNTYGVRILITLSSDALFNETPEKIEQDGFTYNKWIIANK